MTSKEYWQKRETEHAKKNKMSEQDYAEEIRKTYAYMADQIQKEIDGFYTKYATKEGISLAEAKRRVSKLDIEEYGRKAAKYVKEKNFSDQANEEMRLYNATMKINRLELLKANIGLEMVSGFDELQKYFDRTLTQQTIEEFRRQAGILGNSVQENGKMARAIVDASFHNATYSDRIWMYQDMLKAELDKLLKTGLIQGKNPRELAVHLQKRFGASREDAERLMVTELARVQTEAQKQSYIRNGFEEYTYVACGNADVCERCQALDGRHFRVQDMMPGTNAPPMHPRCHCSTAAYEDSAEYEKWLDGYSDHGLDFETWKRADEGESGNIISLRKGTNRVSLTKIQSEAYGRKFNQMTKNTAVNNSLRKYARAMLVHRNGTDGEDLYIISAKTGKRLMSKTTGANELGVELSSDEIKMIQQYAESEGVIGIHNHPTNILPTGSDFVAAGARKYKFGIVATHDGRVFLYKTGEKPFRSEYFNQTVDKYVSTPYNYDIEKAQIRALEEFGKEFGIEWKELK